MSKSVSALIASVDQKAMLARPLSDWHPILSDDCQVYQLDGGGYLAKQFSQINYRFCDSKTVSDILTDNLYSILKSKYFKVITDEVLTRIKAIVDSMKLNLKSVLKTFTFNRHNIGTNPNLRFTQYLPNYCLAFRNGVYNFKDGNWLFKYDTIELNTGLKLISYTHEYIIKWYFNFDFEPLDFSVSDISLKEFYSFLYEMNEVQRNYCFELVHNMSFTQTHEFKIERFEHLCQILGYTCLNSFAQYFVLLIGAGQNGKNSLFDGCFTEHVVPKPSAIDLESIETDNFITGVLEGVSHNIFLETSAKTYKESRMIKALTGSSDQSIEHKGVNQYSGVINCKYLFAGNDKNEIKFRDTTTGFIRRINMFELFYTWDDKKHFMSLGNYFDTSFSGDLHELKDDPLCATLFIYLAMYGIKSGTKDFTKSFAFTHNEWSEEYSDVNIDLKAALDKVRLSQIFTWARAKKANARLLHNGLYARNRRNIIQTIVSDTGDQIFKSIDDLIHSSKTITLEDGSTDEIYDAETYFKDIPNMFISLSALKEFLNLDMTQHAFTKGIQKLYGTNCVVRLGANIACVHCSFKSGKLRILR